jgi:hypothetical protein
MIPTVVLLYSKTGLAHLLSERVIQQWMEANAETHGQALVQEAPWEKGRKNCRRVVQDTTITLRESPKKDSSRFIDTDVVTMEPAWVYAGSSVYKLWLCCFVFLSAPSSESGGSLQLFYLHLGPFSSYWAGLSSFDKRVCVWSYCNLLCRAGVIYLRGLILSEGKWGRSGSGVGGDAVELLGGLKGGRENWSGCICESCGGWGGGKKRKFRIVMKLVSAKADLTIVTSVLSTLRRVPAEDWPSLSQFIFKTVHLHRLSFLSKQLKASWGFQ